MLEAVLVLARLLVLLVAAFMAAPALALTPGGETASGRISASIDGEHTYFVGESAALVHNACFFSVQSADDAMRLASGGGVWPQGMQRANLGTGFYAWDDLASAQRYLGRLESRGVKGLEIVRASIDDAALGGLKRLDVGSLSDDAAQVFMETHSLYGKGIPHGFQYIRRPTNLGMEHFFSHDVFSRFTIHRGGL